MLWPVACLSLGTLAPAPLGEDRGRLLRAHTEGVRRPEEVCMGGSLQRRLSHPLLRSSGPKGGLYSPNAPASQDSAQKSVSAGTWSPVKHGLRQSQDVCLEPEHTSAALASCVADAQAGAQRPLKASVCATLRSVSTETSCSGKHQRKGSGNGAAQCGEHVSPRAPPSSWLGRQVCAPPPTPTSAVDQPVLCAAQKCITSAWRGVQKQPEAAGRRGHTPIQLHLRAEV